MKTIGLLLDTYWYLFIHLFNPQSDAVYREYRATRMFDRGEITQEQAYKVIYGDKKRSLR